MSRCETFAVDTMVTVTDAVSTWSTWCGDFGDSDLSDDAADYPFLLGFEEFWPGLQAFTFASFQTENLIVATIVRSSTGDDPMTLTLTTGGKTPLEIGASVTLSLDTNGMATGDPMPTCVAGETIAKANYNDMTVQLRTTGGGSAVFTDDCEIVIGFADGASRGQFSVEALLASKEMTIKRWSHSFEAPSLFKPLPAMDIVVPADAAAGYAFLTVTLLAGELVRDANNRTPIFGRTGEIYAYKEFEYPDGVVVTLTTRIEPRRAMVEASEDNLVAVLSLPAGGATALFVRDEEVFYDLRAKAGNHTTGISGGALSVRSAPRAIAATPSPVTATIAQGRVGATVLTPGEAGIAIWHTFGAAETYSVQPGSNFDVDETTGLVTVMTALSARRRLRH